MIKHDKKENFAVSGIKNHQAVLITAYVFSVVEINDPKKGESISDKKPRTEGRKLQSSCR